MSRRKLAGSRVLLTGASSGIGRALALELGARQARLALVARREAPLRELAAALQTQGVETRVVVGDLTDAKTRQQALELVQQEFGGLDILINNAGVGSLGRFERGSEARLRQVFEINFFAPAELTRAAIPLLVAGVHPLVVNISSILGYRAIPNMSDYCASKFALTGLGESIAAEFAQRGVDVLTVSPGRTESEFQQNLLTDQREAHWPGLPQTSAAVVARRIVRAMERGQRRSLPNWSAWGMYWGSRLGPGFFDRFLARPR